MAVSSGYDCAGVPIVLRSGSARIGEVLGSFLRAASGAGSAHAPPLQLHVDVDPDFAARAERLADGGRLLDAIDAPGFARRRYADDSGYAFVYHTDRSAARFEPEPARLRIWVADERRAAAARFANLVVADLLRFALPFHGVSLLHAACVVVDGRGVLLCGPSGAGKSLLALRLIERAARLVADDTVALRDTTSGPQCAATPEWMGLRPASLALFPQLRARIESRAESVDAYFVKRLFRPELLFPDLRCPTIAPALLVAISPGEDRAPLLAEIPAREAFTHIVGENYVPFHRHSLPRFAAADVRRAGALVDAVRPYRLSFSAARLDEAVALIGQAVQALGPPSTRRNSSTDSR